MNALSPDDRRGLAARYYPAALGAAAAYGRQRPDLAAEFASAAGLAMIEAAGQHPAYVVPNVRRLVARRCLRVLRAEGRRRRRERRAARPEAAPPRGDHDLSAWVDGLPAAEGRALQLLYGHRMTRAEAAAVLGCCRQHVTDLHARAIARLRASLSVA